MNKESKKLTWAVGLVAGLGVLSIAYAALSSTLNIDGKNASVNAGYVRFLGRSGESDDSGELVADTKGCQPWGIGSINDEYTAKANDGDAEKTISGGIFNGRADANKPGLITGTAGIGADLTKALAEPGTLLLDGKNKAKDRVTITGAKLNDYGSFIVYKLDIINESTNDMRLKTLPEIAIDSIDTASGKATKDNIERVIYTDCSTDNFVKPCTTALTAAANDSGAYDASKKTEYNYLTKNGGTTTWYLRIGFKNYNKDSNNIHGSTTFNFSVAPNWEAVMA